MIRTGEDPRGFVDKHNSQAFGIISLEALDHEFNWMVVLVNISKCSCVDQKRDKYHVCQREIGHVEDHTLPHVRCLYSAHAVIGNLQLFQLEARASSGQIQWCTR